MLNSKTALSLSAQLPQYAFKIKNKKITNASISSPSMSASALRRRQAYTKQALP
jgi:hypothetical protein